MIRIEHSLYRSLGRGEFDYSLAANALIRAGYAAPAKKIHDLMKAGVLVGVKKGLYVLSKDYIPTPICKEALANLIYGPSCISLEYALAYYGLIPERVEVVTSVTPKRDKRFETPLGVFTYRYLAKKKYPEGINLIWVDPQHPVLMASAEKALCDYVLCNKISHLESSVDAQKFLVEDLRMNPENLKHFDLVALHRLNRNYKSKGIDTILAFLEGIRG
ncbi:MAG: hypothetical protein HYU97_00065 [Deltaproteobacteria bacterium]|nr:hypothetical protein [Deltaproteobacteria bacterium]